MRCQGRSLATYSHHFWPVITTLRALLPTSFQHCQRISCRSRVAKRFTSVCVLRWNKPRLHRQFSLASEASRLVIRLAPKLVQTLTRGLADFPWTHITPIPVTAILSLMRDGSRSHYT